TPASRIGLWVATAVVVLAAGYFIVDRYILADSAAEEGWTNSIAVLPFRDFSKNKDQEYFCNGMTDAVIGKLSGIENLKVISMTSVLRYRDSDKDLKTIGRELGVSTILEASFQREGDAIRLQVQLIKVADDDHLWSQTYNRKLESVFEIQDDISRAIVDAMRIQLFSEETTAILRRYTENVEAFDSYARGRQLWIKRDHKNLLKSIVHFERAIELDPNYALAYSGLADAWAVIRGYTDVPGEISKAEALKKAREAAETAIEIDENLAEAHASLGLILRDESDLQGSEREFRKSIELNPGYHWAHFWYSLLLKDMARYQDEIKEEEIAYQLNPMSIPLNSNRATVKWWSLELEEAVILYRRVIEIEPNRMLTYIILSKFLANMGRNDEAISLSEKAVEVDVNAYKNLAYRYSHIGNFDKALWAANKYLGFSQDKYAGYATRAEIFALNGMLDSAIASYSMALDLKPDFANSISKMGNVYMFMQEYGKADSLYRILASHSDKYWRAAGRRSLAQLPLHQGKFKLALELLDKLKYEAITDSINDFRLAEGIFRRATTFQEILGMHDSAIAEYEKVIRVLKDIAPNHGVVHSSRARIGYSHALRGDFVRADKIFEEYKANFDKFGPNAYGVFWFHSGRVELEKGNFDSAIANLERVVMTNPVHHDRQILARCYFGAGRIDDAIVLYEKIINRYDARDRASWPAWSVMTHYNLGKTYEAAGRYNDAVKQYETFLNIWRDADDGIKIIEDAKERLAKLKNGS
ncbi:MAG: tetratricopeptide repeat protein, partial [candidate division Zixibacteria bacterium]|nr:tetratricopeptide repeat protein [candidate division Zixibacteria bacterium]